MQAPARPRALTIVAAAATVVLLAALGVVFSKSGHHRTGTDAAGRQRPVALDPRAKVCQGGVDVPADTARIRFFPQPGRTVGSFAVSVVDAAGRELASGTVAPHAYRQSEAAVASFAPVAREVAGGSVCIANRGRVAAAIIGAPANPGAQPAALAPGARPVTPPGLELHLDYQQRRAQTWWAFAGTLADRFGLVKATFFGAWTFWATLAALLALALGTIWYARRALAR